MSNWIDLDADFGTPMVRLVVNVRDIVAKYIPLRQALASTHRFKKDELPLVAESVAAFVGQERPDLRGCTIIGIDSPRSGLRVAIWVMHPSLPRVPVGEAIPEQRLETCWTCGKPLPVDKSFLRSVPLELSEEEMTDPGEAIVDCDFPIRGRPDRPMKTVEVCSEACVTAINRSAKKAEWDESDLDHLSDSVEAAVEKAGNFTINDVAMWESSGRHDVANIKCPLFGIPPGAAYFADRDSGGNEGSQRPVDWKRCTCMPPVMAEQEQELRRHLAAMRPTETIIQALDGVEDDDEVLPPRSLHIGRSAHPSLAQVSGLPPQVLELTHEGNQTAHPGCLAHHRRATDNAGANRVNKPHAECRAEHVEYSDPRPSCGHHCMDYQPEGRHVASFKCPCGAEYRRSGNRWERI